MDGNTSSDNQIDALGHEIQVLRGIVTLLIDSLQECETVEEHIAYLEQAGVNRLQESAAGPRAAIERAWHAELTRQLAAVRVKLQNRREQLAAARASKQAKQVLEARRAHAERQRQEAEQAEECSGPRLGR
ncbi:hypothetical protein D3C81_1426470 [compost metagenome]